MTNLKLRSLVPIQLDVECLTCVVSFCNFVVSNLCFSLTPMSKGSSSVMLGVVFGKAKGGGAKEESVSGCAAGTGIFMWWQEFFTNAWPWMPVVTDKIKFLSRFVVHCILLELVLDDCTHVFSASPVEYFSLYSHGSGPHRHDGNQRMASTLSSHTHFWLWPQSCHPCIAIGRS